MPPGSTQTDRPGRPRRPDQRTHALILTIALIVPVPLYAGDAPTPAPEADRLRTVVETLASPEFAGRSGAGAQKAADYLVDRFRELKLEGAFDNGEYSQTIPGQEPGTQIGRNVAARLVGSDPKLRDQYVLVAAHFDHLGVRGGRLYPGADDNASAVAMLLEVARCLKTSPNPPKRSVLFIGFDLEEAGLFGSRYFVAHPPVSLDRITLFVTADMIGRSLAGLCGDHVFVMGTEHAPATRPWIKAAAKGRPLTVDLLGADILVLNRSDYGPFRSRGIPFLFFTTGENPCYHTPRDVPETLDHAKMLQISRMIERVVRSAVDAPEAARWHDHPDNPLAEAVALRAVLRILYDHRNDLDMGAAQAFVVRSTLSLLDGVVERGVMTPEERARAVQGARVVLFTVL